MKSGKIVFLLVTVVLLVFIGSGTTAESFGGKCQYTVCEDGDCVEKEGEEPCPADECDNDDQCTGLCMWYECSSEGDCLDHFKSWEDEPDCPDSECDPGGNDCCATASDCSDSDDVCLDGSCVDCNTACGGDNDYRGDRGACGTDSECDLLNDGWCVFNEDGTCMYDCSYLGEQCKNGDECLCFKCEACKCSSLGDDVCTGSGCCTPETCTSLGVECGTWDDGCGGTIDCGDCGSGEFCNDGYCRPARTPVSPTPTEQPPPTKVPEPVVTPTPIRVVAKSYISVQLHRSGKNYPGLNGVGLTLMGLNGFEKVTAGDGEALFIVHDRLSFGEGEHVLGYWDPTTQQYEVLEPAFIWDDGLEKWKAWGKPVTISSEAVQESEELSFKLCWY